MNTFHHANIDGHKIFYREAGANSAPVIVLLHGFPSSSHMFRDLIPKLADRFHVIAPDYLGFGYSDQPGAKEFHYTFDNLSAQIEKLLFTHLGLKKFTLYVQDYGAPIGFRIASRRPEAIEGIVVQNGNAYLEGVSPALEPMTVFWKNRNPETEAPLRGFLDAETTQFQYEHGASDPSKISPDSYTFDQLFLDRSGNDAIQLDLFFDYRNNVALYPEWQAYFRAYQPPTLIVWGQNDPFFTVEGAKAFLRDIPRAELHLLEAGHFALEEHSGVIANYIKEFLGKRKTQLKCCNELASVC
ncbi:alpha/beta fold hydrolase [Methylosarcina fibrata]|uniref:alpha/beta fold hydrolase n=1 Tax=Methylosarcina fibrata TaxID=105972 RepID=UPI00035DC453|nr:alpha/beta hydrolase [Methylosarcina fibrata]